MPIGIEPDGGASRLNPFAYQPAAEQEYRETINLLTRSQVAVYPVDARGLQGSPAFQAASGASIAPVTARNDTSGNQRAAEHLTMTRMAQDTGGRAFYNVNDLSKALSDAIAEGSSYYTLAYTPASTNKQSDYRRIEIKVPQKGVTLTYRKEYFSVDKESKIGALNFKAPAKDAPAPAAEKMALLRAMVFGVPAPSQIRFKTRVLPVKGVDDQAASGNAFTPVGLDDAKGNFRRYVVDFDTEGHDYAFTPNPDGTFHLSAEFAAFVYQRSDGKLVNAQTGTITTEIDARQRTLILTGGMPFHFEVSVPAKGQYTLRPG